ncbi:MAG: sensor histidine kinase [Gorillibacterium sp.]|nr:sensor histidine kinase [Gorillibacterium sp.]
MIAIRKLITWTGNLKMQHKLLLAYIMMVLHPIVIIGSFFVFQMRENLVDYSNVIHDSSIQQISSNLSNSLKGYIQFTNGMQTDKQLLTYLELTYPQQDQDHDAEFLNSKRDYSLLNDVYTTKLISAYEGIQLKVYTTNSTIIRDNKFLITLTDEVQKEMWFKNVLEAGGNVVVSKPYQNEYNTQVFSIGRQLRTGYNDEYLSVLRMEIPIEKLYRLIEKEGKNKKIYIVNDQGIVYASSFDQEWVGKKVSMLSQELASLKTKKVIWQNANYFVYQAKVDSTDPKSPFFIYALVSRSSVLGKFNHNVKVLVTVSLGVLLLSIILMHFSSNTLTKRLKQLVQNMTAIRQQSDFNVFVSCEYRDEIGELSRQFNKMIKRIDELIKEVYIAESHMKSLQLEKKEAELKALQSQINPHFLFNTMESIRMSLIKKGDLETSDIVGSFAQLFRKSIYWESDEITLKQEIDIIEHYLRIQKFRYRDKIDFIVDIQPELYSLKIPKFTLQPIVENAIYHGLEKKACKGRIEIFSTIRGDIVEIFVFDDGVGIPEATQQEISAKLLESTAEEGEGSIGLINVNRRLKNYFGLSYGMSIKSDHSRGTLVTFKLPKQQ